MAGPTLCQVTVANPQATSHVDTRYAVVVPPPYVAQILCHLAIGTIAPTGFWNLAQHVVDHPVRSGSCLAFVDWCRVAVAGGIGVTNPLQNMAGVPTFCCVDAALGHSCQAIRLQDYPQLSGAAAMMAAATPIAFQPIVEVLVAIQTDNQTRPSTIVMERAAMVDAHGSYGPQESPSTQHPHRLARIASGPGCASPSPSNPSGQSARHGYCLSKPGPKHGPIGHVQVCSLI
jgi:hypothetical protein